MKKKIKNNNNKNSWCDDIIIDGFNWALNTNNSYSVAISNVYRLHRNLFDRYAYTKGEEKTMNRSLNDLPNTLMHAHVYTTLPHTNSHTLHHCSQVRTRALAKQIYINYVLLKKWISISIYHKVYADDGGNNKFYGRKRQQLKEDSDLNWMISFSNCVHKMLLIRVCVFCVCIDSV